MRLLIAYEVIALAMVFVACFAEDRDEKTAAIMVAVSRFIGDLAWIYLPLAPATIMHQMGFAEFTGTDTRALTDATFASLIGVWWLGRWWGRAVWIGFVAMLFAHGLRETTDLGYVGYAYAINGLFLAMASVFFLLGGGEVCRHGRCFLSRCHTRYRRHSFRSTRQKE